MTNASELKSGWLNRDLIRAERRVNEWKITKYVATSSNDEDSDNLPKEDSESGDDESGPLRC